VKKVLILALLATSFSIPNMSVSHADVCSTIKLDGKYISTYKGDWYGEKFAKRQYNYFGALLKNPKCSTPLDSRASAQEMVRAVLSACETKMPEFMNGYGPKTSKWLCAWAKTNKRFAAK
jgi:hypothetical protein